MLICQRVAKCPQPTTERERNPQILYQKNRAPKTQPRFVGSNALSYLHVFMNEIQRVIVLPIRW